MRYTATVDGQGPQIAFALPRPFGSAVERNRGRRRLRSAFIEAWEADEAAGPDGAYLLSGNRGLLHAPFGQLVDDVGRCFERLARS
jgi:RNase P protein component